MKPSEMPMGQWFVVKSINSSDEFATMRIADGWIYHPLPNDTLGEHEFRHLTALSSSLDYGFDVIDCEVTPYETQYLATVTKACSGANCQCSKCLEYDRLYKRG